MQREDWIPFRLDQLGFVGRGRSRSRPRNDPALYGGPYPLFETGDIKFADLYLSEPKKTYNDKGLAQSKLWNPGTLCITIAANIAETAILKIKACFPDSVAGFIADTEKTDVRYIKYYIDFIKLQMQNISRGTTQDNLSVEKLLSFEFLVPPLPTQRKIAAVLSAYDDLIENNTRRIEILEEMAGAIYREWFVEFRFPGHEQVEMVESELGLIPQGWEVKRLSDLVETQYGYTESATEEDVGPKFVRGKDINKNSYIDWDTVPFCPIESEKYAKYRLHAGDILVIRMADPGKVAIIEKEIDAVFASYLIRLKLNSKRLSPYYLFCTLLDERYQNYVYGVSTGTTRKSASAGVITGFDLVVPTDEIKDRFEVVISSLRKTLNNLLEKNINLRQTRDLLLPKLISGEIDICEVDVDTNSNMEVNNG